MKLAAAIAFLTPLAFAQPPVSSPPASVPSDSAPQISTLNTRSTLVVVPALVRNKAGELVYTLKASDFTLTDDGVEQKLTLEEDTGSEPLALVVLIEAGAGGNREVGKYSALAPAIETIVGGVQHRIAVVGFDSQPVLLQDFTQSFDAVGAAIHTIEGGDDGGAILDSIGYSVDMLRKQPIQYRRAILLISETNDHGSHIKLDEALRAIGDTNTAIYTIAFSSSKIDEQHEASRFSSDKPGPAGGCLAKDHADDPDTSNNRAEQAYDCASELLPPLRLAQMAYLAARNGLRTNVPETVARLTGGEYFKFTDAKSIDRSMHTISNHLPNRYVLSFQPQSPHPGMHAIDLKLKDYAHLTVNARSSYWADEGPSVTTPPASTAR